MPLYGGEKGVLPSLPRAKFPRSVNGEFETQRCGRDSGEGSAESKRDVEQIVQQVYGPKHPTNLAA
jgi:hypothetical protein